MKDKEVSVIIPAKNEESYLKNTLESLKFQKGISKMEIIVSISSDTKDRTALIAREYGCNIVIGGRPAMAKNNGARNALYDTLFFIDADTYTLDDYFISNAFDEFCSRKLDIVGTLFYIDFSGDFFKSFVYDIFDSIKNYESLRREKGSKPRTGTGMFFKKDAFFSLGGFKEGIFGEDSELVERAVRNNPDLNFGILRNCGYLRTSPRRYENNGVLRTILKYTYLNAKAEIFGYDSLKGTDESFFRNGQSGD